MSERWFKQSSQAVHDPKWRTIAARAEAMFVEAFAAFESGEAWSAEHGGSLAGYDLEVEAAALEIPLDRFKRIWRAMVDKGIAIIEAMVDDVRVAAGRLTAWAKRQARSLTVSPPAAAAAVRTRGRPRQRRRASPEVVIDAAVDDWERVTEAVTGDPSPCTPFPDQNRGDPPPCSPPPLREGDATPLVASDPNQGGAAPAGQPVPADDIAIGAWSPRVTPLMAGTSLRALAAGSEPSFPPVISGGADVPYARPPRRRYREPTARETVSAVCAEWAAALRGQDFWGLHRGTGSGMAAAGG